MTRLQSSIIRSTLLLIVMFVSIVCLLKQPVMADFQRTKIAVLDFELIGDKLETTGMGAILSEWFITSIVKSGRFDVVERAMLQKIVSEQRLSTTGIIDDSSASELGKILGVKVIITGSVLKIGTAIEINSRVISVESGSIIAAENIRAGTNSDLHTLVDQLTDKIMRNFPLTGYIVKRVDNTALIDLGLESGLNTGTEFIVYKEGEVIKHPKTGEVLDVEQVLTGRLKISSVNRNVALGEIISEEPAGIEYGQLVKSVQSLPEKRIAPPTPRPSSPPPPVVQQQAPSLATETPLTIVTLKPDKIKIVAPQQEPVPAYTIVKQPAITQVVEPVRKAPQSNIPTGTYKVAIFPWIFDREGGSFVGIVVDRIKYRINELPKVSLKYSYYEVKGVAELDYPANAASRLWYSSSPNMDLLRQKGEELGFNAAVLGKLNVKCRWSDNCQVRNMNITLVDLTTGKAYSEAGSSWDDDARDYIGSLTSKVFKSWAASAGL